MLVLGSIRVKRFEKQVRSAVRGGEFILPTGYNQSPVPIGEIHRPWPYGNPARLNETG